MNMEKKAYNKEEIEAQLNEWKKRIEELRSIVEDAREDIKIGVLGDLEKMENQRAVIKNRLIKLNEEKEEWEDIESSIGDALVHIKNVWDQTHNKYNF
jgi:chromosome segregation ATPase